MGVPAVLGDLSVGGAVVLDHDPQRRISQISAGGSRVRRVCRNLQLRFGQPGTNQGQPQQGLSSRVSSDTDQPQRLHSPRPTPNARIPVRHPAQLRRTQQGARPSLEPDVWPPDQLISQDHQVLHAGSSRQIKPGAGRAGGGSAPSSDHVLRLKPDPVAANASSANPSRRSQGLGQMHRLIRLQPPGQQQSVETRGGGVRDPAVGHAPGQQHRRAQRLRRLRPSEGIPMGVSAQVKADHIATPNAVAGEAGIHQHLLRDRPAAQMQRQG